MVQLVFTLHGINSEGEWQEGVKDVLDPHFKCVSLKYEHFRKFGALKILFNWRRMNNARDHLVEQYVDETRGPTGRPHFIGHSFGTVLGMDMMATYPYVRFDRIILAGSPLPSRFDWQAKSDHYHQVRNETGRRDWVVWLAGNAGRLRRYFGNAGRSGFRGEGVHTLNGPMNRCDICNGQPGHERARVHNVPLSRYGHGTMFLTNRHAEDLWLPVLWGYAPCDYHAFKELCVKAQEFEAEGLLPEKEEMARQLLDLKLEWKRSSRERITLRQYIRGHLETYERTSGTALGWRRDTFINTVIIEVINAFTDALEELEKDRAGRNDLVVRALCPSMAVGKAIRQYPGLK